MSAQTEHVLGMLPVFAHCHTIHTSTFRVLLRLKKMRRRTLRSHASVVLLSLRKKPGAHITHQRGHGLHTFDTSRPCPMGLSSYTRNNVSEELWKEVEALIVLRLTSGYRWK